MSETFALASAYAELMERLQNKALYRENLKFGTKYFTNSLNKEHYWAKKLNQNKSILDFLYYPDEEMREISGDYIKDDVMPKFFPNTHSFDAKHNTYRSIFAPFYNLTMNCSEFIPIEYLRHSSGTTGMCAGNTPEEAIVQGLNEIAERYVLQYLFLNNVSFPNIDIDIFAGCEIYDKILALSSNYVTIVKDCSLDGALPVLGLIIIDQNNGKIAFKLGADYSIITALERCYTEIFQGKNVIDAVFNEYDLANSVDLSQYIRCRRDGTGLYPTWVLTESDKTAKFPHIDFKDYKTELAYYVECIRKMGCNIYIKDNSFLGFDAFTIYVPGLSDISERLFNISTYINDNHEKINVNPKMRINTLSNEELQRWIDCEELQGASLTLQQWNNGKSNKWASLLLKISGYIKLKDIKQAYIAMNMLLDFLREHNKSTPVVYRCYKDILYCKLSNGSTNMLYMIYGKGQVDKLTSMIDNSQDIFNSMQLPSCYECDKCP